MLRGESFSRKGVGTNQDFSLLPVLHRFFLQREVWNVPEITRKFPIVIGAAGGEAEGGADGNRSLYTWRAKNAVWVTIVKSARKETCIYVHELQAAFIANECASLHSDCPVNTAVLGQMVVDCNESGNYEPRIMFFDVLSFGDDDVSGMPPSGRHSILRSDVAPFLEREEHFVVQWAGYREAAESFCDPSANTEAQGKLPHRVDYVFEMPCGKKPGFINPVTMF